MWRCLINTVDAFGDDRDGGRLLVDHHHVGGHNGHFGDDGDGGRLLVDHQVTGEGSTEVVGLETLLREGKASGGKVSQIQLAVNSTFLVVFFFS